MDGFKLGADVNTENVFLVNHSELEGRLDTDYYRPKISALEKKVRQKTNKKLNDFIIRIASGATPSVQEEARFYCTKENGIPFLRVQNLNVSGELSLDDVKYINQDTHNKYLKRSQVSNSDLLVKITGVGRMAIASVAPMDFDGNTNQHMVVIKTRSQEQSRYLAKYLNLDIIEALATRRATGATRPALDYPALKSIPVIEDIDFSLLKEAELQKQQKEQEAQELLDGIDGYLLNALGITLPEQDNSLEKRMFTVPFNEVTGGRLDSQFYKDEFQHLIEIISTKKHFKLKEIVEFSAETWNQSDYFDETFPYIEISEIELNTGEIANVKHVAINEAPSRAKMIVRQGDIIISTTRPTRGAIAHNQLEGINIASTGFAVIRTLKSEVVSKEFLFYLLKMSSTLRQMEQRATGGNYPAITQEELGNIVIPYVEKTHQTEIAAYITQLRAQAKQLQTEATNLIATAKVHIERMILGN